MERLPRTTATSGSRHPNFHRKAACFAYAVPRRSCAHASLTTTKSATTLSPSVNHVSNVGRRRDCFASACGRTTTASTPRLHAHPAALAIEPDATIVSFDRDFARFADAPGRGHLIASQQHLRKPQDQALACELNGSKQTRWRKSLDSACDTPMTSTARQEYIGKEPGQVHWRYGAEVRHVEGKHG